MAEGDIALGNKQVYLSQAAFHLLEDQLRSWNDEERKRYRLRDAEAEAAGYGDAFNASSEQLPLVPNDFPFIRADQYDDEYDKNHSFCDEDDRSWMTGQQDDSAFNFGSESYAPSRNMFHDAEKAGLDNKTALLGEI
ncbi:hypothetical protein AAF712_014895 [Marasmius tenuissimus]|uniref:Uncharacterized protein n=1 Tax=Marasmius tenuissimus TaxID=585030 RepID=A0ABR2ZBQ4_9AGAR